MCVSSNLSLDDDDIVHVGAGCTFDEIYTFVEDHNLSVVGARNLDFSISGFSLGGELSYTSLLLLSTREYNGQ
jgi:hypothetical protein